MTADDEFRLPDGWKSWPPPIKRDLRRLLTAFKNHDQRRNDGQLNLQLAWLDPFESFARDIAAMADEASQAAIAARSEELLAAIARQPDELLGLTEL